MKGDTKKNRRSIVDLLLECVQLEGAYVCGIQIVFCENRVVGTFC